MTTKIIVLIACTSISGLLVSPPSISFVYGEMPETQQITATTDPCVSNPQPGCPGYVEREETELRIPTLAWWGVQEHTVERYRELKESGITHNFTFCANVNVQAQAMDAAEVAGIKMIIHCPELKTAPETVVNRFKDHPALAGYHLTDEPNSSAFPGWGELARRIQAVDNDHFCYVNLFPNHASAEQLGTATYREHVRLLLQEVPVQFLSFDHYPIIVNGSGVRSLRSQWYQNLEIIAEEARKAEKPFWAFALTTAHTPYPIPTLADIRLQVYSNLAYGAQGIQYFTYWTPKPGTWDFHDGPIDYNTQQKTATYDLVKQMNGEIENLSNVFFGAQVISVKHIATNAQGENVDVPTGTTRFNFANRPTAASIIKTFTTTGATNAVVSFLQNGDKSYMAVVNCNLDGGGDMTVKIEGKPGLRRVLKNGATVPVSKANSNQTITPGDILIYSWN